MRKQNILLLLLLAVFTLQGKAQNKVAYDYDMAGNRIARKLVVLSNPNYAKKDLDSSVPVEEQIGERKITVYPNPTKGNLAVEIVGGDAKDELRIVLYDTKGQQLMNKKTDAVTTPVDMYDLPAAQYILRVQTGNKVTEFKIIKI